MESSVQANIITIWEGKAQVDLNSNAVLQRSHEFRESVKTNSRAISSRPRKLALARQQGQDLIAKMNELLDEINNKYIECHLLDQQVRQDVFIAEQDRIRKDELARLNRKIADIEREKKQFTKQLATPSVFAQPLPQQARIEFPHSRLQKPTVQRPTSPESKSVPTSPAHSRRLHPVQTEGKSYRFVPSPVNQPSARHNLEEAFEAVMNISPPVDKSKK